MHETCCLTKPSLGDEPAVACMCAEWRSFGGRVNPGLLRRFTGDFSAWLRMLSDWEHGIGIGDEVPQTLYLMKRDNGEVLGAVSIRHGLNESNFVDGGHVGYGIRPSCRGKGYGSAILRLALMKMTEMGIKRALVTCDAKNLASAKVIVKNGGVLENRVPDEEGKMVERYWIELANRDQ